MLLPLPTPFGAALGQRVEDARGRLLWDADFRSLPRQQLPATQLGWQALIAGGYAAAAGAPALSNAWVFNQASGADVPDAIGGKTLTNVGDAVRAGRTIVGLHRGAAGAGRWHVGAEFADAEGNHFAAANVADFDPGAASWAVLLVLRAGATPAADGALVSKQQASGAGWSLYRTSAGTYEFNLDDGLGGGASLSIAAPGRDGAPHYIFVRINRTAGELQGFTDMGAVASAGLGGAGAITSSVTMRVGGPATGHAINTTIPWQCAWFGILTGAAAEAVTSTHLGRFWNHARRPAAVTTYNRNGRAMTIIEDDPTLGVRVAGWQPDQVAWELDRSSGTFALGAAVYPAITNKLADASMLSWPATDIDVLAGSYDAPNGMREAVEVVATAVPNGIRRTSAFTIGELVQFSVFAGGEGTTPGARLFLQVWDVTFTTLKVSVAIDLSTRWSRASLGGWTADATATFGFQIGLEAAGQASNLWGAQLRVGNEDGPLVWSDGASATCPAVDVRVAGAAAAILRGAEGEIIAEYACARAIQASDRFVVDVSNAASNINRRFLKVPADASTTSGIYDSGAVNLTGPVIASGAQARFQNDRKRAELAWASTRYLVAPNNRARLRTDETVEAAAVTVALAASDTVTTAWLGQDQANANQLAGVLRRVRCYGAAS